MTRSTLADILDEVASQLIAGVEETMSPTAVALPLRRTIERLPGLMRDLVERLRAGRVDEPEKRTELRSSSTSHRWWLRSACSSSRSTR